MLLQFICFLSAFYYMGMNKKIPSQHIVNPYVRNIEELISCRKFVYTSVETKYQVYVYFNEFSAGGPITRLISAFFFLFFPPFLLKVSNIFMKSARL